MLWMLALLVQDPVKLEPKAQNGDRTTVKITSSVTLEITTKDAEGTKKRVVTLDSGEDFSQEVLLAEAGLVKQAKVRCDRSFRSKSVEGGGGESWTTALQGVNFRVTWTDAIKVPRIKGASRPARTAAVVSPAARRVLPRVFSTSQ